MMMKSRLVLAFSLMSLFALGQNEPLSREDKDEKNAARMDRINTKNDIAVFRKQLAGSKEYSAERARLATMQKAGKGQFRLSAVVDTGDLDNSASQNLLNGYIREDEGDNSTNVYEAVFDRKMKKIISMKKTADAEAMDEDDADDQADTDKSSNHKKMNSKKVKDADDEDEDVPTTRRKPVERDE